MKFIIPLLALAVLGLMVPAYAETITEDTMVAQFETEPDRADRPIPQSHSSLCEHVGIFENNNDRIVELCTFGNDKHVMGISEHVIAPGSFLNVFGFLGEEEDVDMFNVAISPYTILGLDRNNLVIDVSVPVDRDGNGNMYIKMDDRFEPSEKYHAYISYTNQGEVTSDAHAYFFVLPSFTQGPTITDILHRLTALETDTLPLSTVSGTITDSDGNITSKAVVSISTEPLEIDIPTNFGVYVFENVPAGTYDITVATLADGELTKSVTVPGGDYDLSFVPVETPLISGTVSDTNGVAKFGVVVAILNENFTTLTNDNGMYSFDDDSLIGKTVSLYILAPVGYVNASSSYFTDVTVVAGETQTVNFTMRSTTPAPTTPVTPPTAPTTPRVEEDIVIDTCSENIFGFPVVTGRYTAGDDHTLVTITFSVKDGNGRVLKTAIENISDISAGETRPFEIMAVYLDEWQRCSVKVTDRL